MARRNVTFPQPRQYSPAAETPACKLPIAPASRVRATLGIAYPLKQLSAQWNAKRRSIGSTSSRYKDYVEGTARVMSPLLPAAHNGPTRRVLVHMTSSNNILEKKRNERLKRADQFALQANATSGALLTFKDRDFELTEEEEGVSVNAVRKVRQFRYIRHLSQ